MKKTITLLFILSLPCLKAQVVADFETFTLSANSFYSGNIDFQTTNAIFNHDTSGGYWSAGYSYTNKNDTVTAGFSNLYGCIANKGYNNSNFYLAAQPSGKIKLKAPQNTVLGFYVTNTTYAWKSMKSGDSFAKKFGGTTGNDPDWFKITVKGYQNGALKADSSTFYLANYTYTNNAQDYIVKNWQWVDVSNLGIVDSIKIKLSSSDVGSFGMNTPGFFSMDNFITSQITGINELSFIENFKIYPNPANEAISFEFNSKEEFTSEVKIYNVLGSEVKSKQLQFNNGQNTYKINISDLNEGIYFIELNNQRYKFVKN